TDQTYLNPLRSHASASSTSRMSRRCSAPAGSASTSCRGTWAWMKRPNSMRPSRVRSPRPERQPVAARATAVLGRGMELVEIGHDLYPRLHPAPPPPPAHPPPPP